MNFVSYFIKNGLGKKDFGRKFLQQLLNSFTNKRIAEVDFGFLTK